MCQRWQETRRVLSIAKGQCAKGNVCSFRQDENYRGKANQNDGKSSLKGKSLRGRSLSGKGYPEDRAKTTSVEILRITHVIFGILPNVNITKHNRDANSMTSVYSGTKRLTVSPTRSRRKVVVKVLLLCWRISEQLGCVFQDVERPISKSISRKGPTFLGPKRSLHLSKGTLRSVKFGKKGPSQGITQHSDPHERGPYAPKFEDRSQEETLKQARCARTRLQKCGVYQRHPWRNPRKRFCGRLQSFNARAEQERSELSGTGHYGYPETLQRLSQPTEKCKRTRKCTSTILIYS